MREQLERFGPWAIGAALVYCAWSGLSADAAAKQAERPKPAEIPESCLSRRGPTETLPTPRDPFQAAWAPYGPEFSPEYIAAQHQKKLDLEREAIRKANDEALAKKKADLTSVVKREAALVGFTLSLDAVARLDGEATARICGRNVKVGEPIPGLGVEPAPTLVRIEGTAADVEWRGRIVTIRLDDAPIYVSPTAAPDAPLDSPGPQGIRTEPRR